MISKHVGWALGLRFGGPPRFRRGDEYAAVLSAGGETSQMDRSIAEGQTHRSHARSCRSSKEQYSQSRVERVRAWGPFAE